MYGRGCVSYGMSFVKGILLKNKVKMAGQRTLQCIFRPIGKEEIKACVEGEFATLEKRLLFWGAS